MPTDREAIRVTEIGEDILIFDVSDDVLERARQLSAEWPR